MRQFLTFISLVITLLHQGARAESLNFKSDSVRAIELSRKASDLGRNGQFAESLSFFLESLEIRKKIYGNEDPKLAPVLLGLGVTYKNLGQLDLALKYYKLAEKNYKNPTVTLFTNIGSVYQSKLDYNRALSYYSQAIELINTNKNYSDQEIAGVNYNIALILYLTNKLDEAYTIINQNINNAFLEDQVQYNFLLAFIFQLKGEFGNSKLRYEKGISIAKKLYGQNHSQIANAYLNYSLFLIVNNRFQDAEKMLEKAVQTIQQSNSTIDLSSSDYFKYKGYWFENLPVSTENIASFKRQKIQNLENAVDWYKKSLNALNFSFEESDVSNLNAKNYVSLLNCIAVLKLVADNYTERDKLEQLDNQPIFTKSLEKAIETYQIIGTLIQRARKEISNDESKMELTTLEYSTFNKIIEASYSAFMITKDVKYLELAFQNTERLKSSSLFENISNQLALQNSVVPDSLLEQEFKLNNTIASLNEKIFEESSQSFPDSSALKAYNNEVFNATRQREELNLLIENNYPDYYELKYSKSMFSARDIQKKLKGDQVIIEFHISEIESLSELYLFVIEKQGIEIRRQKITPEFQVWIEDIFQFMSSSEFLLTTKNETKDFCVASNKLYQILIQPIENQLKNKKVTIIPDGKLSYIPFDALLKSLPDTSKTIELNKLDYSIRHFTFNYANSANLLFSSKSERKKMSVKSAAFAPIYKEDDFIEYAGQRIPLIPLNGIQKEIQNVAGLINCKVFSKEEATEENFRKYAEQFDILHLAMHAFVNDSIPALSSFAFTQTKNDDLEKNGLLNTTDIYNLKLNAKLTVLTACNTGTGKLRKGEGIMSLARGFLYAGCPSVIMSLWEVEDNSGTSIITSFYKNLKRGKSKDEALRKAKLDYLDSVNSRMAHPHYWLGFISVGSEKPLYISYDFYFFVILIIALAGIGIDQIIRIKKARKKRAL